MTRCLRDVRKEQRYPVVAMELRQDLLWIDEMISQGQAAAWFDAEGEMHTADGPRPGCNLFAGSLADSFRRALPRAVPAR